MEGCQEDSSGHVQEVMNVLRDGDVRWEEPMHPIEVKQVKEIILVSSVGAYFLDPDANLIELWAPRPSPTS